MTHKFVIELVDDYKGYEQDVDYLERIYGAEEYNGGWIACSGCKEFHHKECEHYGEV